MSQSNKPSFPNRSKIRRAVVVAAAFLLTGVAAAEPVVSIRAGNLFLSESGSEKQLTISGRDSLPLLAPDGKWIAFVRSIDGKPIASGSADDREPAELWQIRCDGQEPRRLAKTRSAEKLENMIAAFDHLQFSADGRLIYFISPAWTTSGAIHVVARSNGKERFVLAGNDLQVIHSGKYRDYLLVSQHRYFIGGGSYDWYWLFRPDGKEVGPVGDETDNFRSLYLEDKPAPVPGRQQPHRPDSIEQKNPAKTL